MIKNLLATLFFFFVLGQGAALAQCCCATNLGTISPNLTWQYAAPSCHGYYSFQTVAGCTYQFTYCSQFAPSAYYSGDPYLTILTGPTTGGVVANDDYCGLGSYLSWTAPSSGTFYLQVGSWAQGGTCACGLNRNMGYRSTNCTGGLTSPTSITTTASTICPGQSATLTAQGVVGTAYWFTGGCNTVGQIATGNTVTVSPTVTTTYYARNFSNNQWSASCASITITVGSPSPSPTVSGNLNLCGSGTTVLTASGAAAYTWFANSNATNQLSTNAVYTTPIINQNTTYYVQGSVAGAPPGTQTFNYSGNVQNWTVPTGVTSITFTAEGAQGGTGTAGYGAGGLGGRVQGSLSVTPGQVLNVYVGQMPLSNIGGFNGGGNGANNTYGRGGGGATDIRVGGIALANRVVVAAGGGGGGTNCFSAGTNSGGVGGGTTGGNGFQCNAQTNYVGFGGTPTAGGINLGGLGQQGTLGIGGNGGTTYGGGGGGGYYGGGGGSYGGGGGGSSFALAPNVSNATHTSGVKSGDGQLTISWSGAGCPSLLVPVTITVNPAPVVTVNSLTICAGQSATLNATSTIPGGTYTWSPGSSIGSSVVVSPITTTQYTVSYTSAGCPGVSATGTVTVAPNPPAPTAPNVTLCGPGSTTLTASGGQNNTYIWYTNANGTGQLATTSSYTTPTLQSTTTYYVQTGTSQGGFQNFPFTGGIQNFTAPITGIYTIEGWGAKGGDDGNLGANGGYATGTIALTAGQTLTVYTGGMGTNCAVGNGGGWNGGGNAGPQGCSGGGGGASDVRLGGVALANRILVAGGGGGAGCCGVQAGAGGGLTGNNGSGSGGSQVAGGAGNAAGSIGLGGNKNGDGGGGGGGYYGGGAAVNDDGGGGGSSYVGGVLGGSTILGNLAMPNPVGGSMNGNATNGYVRITWIGVSCSSLLTPVTVTINPVPVVSVNSLTVCAGQVATLTASASVPNGTFTWSPGGATGNTISVTPNTTTIYTATYLVSGCPSVTGTGTVTVNPLQPITGTLSACFGLTSQLANVVTPGTWSSSNTGVAAISAGGLVTGISAGTSTITYNASNGCSTTAQFTVFPQPTLTATPSNVLCFGGSGSVVLNATGANAPYTYGGSPTQNLSPGVYIYTATSLDGCVSAPVSVTINQPQGALVLSSTQVNVLCFGNNTGSIDLSVVGGTAPYTYAWSNNTTLQDPLNLIAGTYTVTVTDANGCTATSTVTITQPTAALTLSTTQVNVLCFGNSTGSVNLTATGGTAPYTYLWSNNGTAEDPTNMPVGTYTVTVTDANGCIATTSVTILQPTAPLALSTIQVNILCFGNSSGSVNLTVTGGTAPYTYLWSNNGTSEDPSNMAAGSYNVTVTDANGCTAQTSVTLTQPLAGLVLTSTQVDVLCFGNSTGSINLTVAGGTAPFTYAWSNNTTLQDPQGLAAGTYTVTVTDANGCTAQTSVTITQPTAALTVSTTIQNILCLNGTGSVNSTASGGVAPYTYSWSNQATTQNISNLQAASYTVTVTDANGCTATAIGVVSITLSTVPVQIINSTGTAILTCTTPSISLQATGGVSYIWTGGQTPNTANNVVTVPGSYTVNMIDPNGCPVSQSIVITQNITIPNAGITNATGTTIIDCNAPSINLLATGGGTYQWNNGLGTNAPITVSQAGSFTVVVTASNGCLDSSNVVVTVAPVPLVTGIDTTICSGQSVLIVPVYYPAGGQAIWTNGLTTPTQTVSPSTTTMYSVLYTWNGCTATEDITVTVNPTPTLNVNSASICFGDTTVVTAQPNLPNGTYSWSAINQSGQSLTVFPTQTTSYTSTYTLNGCTSTAATGTVTVNPLPVVTVANVTICQGQSGTLSATTNPSGGTYLWSQGSTTATITESPTTTTSYDVIYTANGCVGNTVTATMTVLPLPNVSFTVDTTNGCVPVTVSLLADTTGQNATYAWTSSGSGSQTGVNPQMTFVNGGCYDLTLTATMNGCTNTSTATSLICVQNYPMANFYSSPGSFSESNQTLSFVNTSIGATGYTWNFGDGSLSNEENPDHYFQGVANGATVTLIATTSMGCMDSISTEIEANLGAIYYIPNTFTPDGDKYNQVFRPVFTVGVSYEDFEMLIFNRWGEVVFESRNLFVGWDGSYGMEGIDCESGTYTYRIKVKITAGDELKIITGHVNLLR